MSAHATVFAQYLVENSSILDGINDLQQTIAEELSATLDQAQLEILIQKAIYELEDRIGKDDTMRFLVRITHFREGGDSG